MNFLNDLNEAQKQAVIHANGPVMVLAGAGSGKTRVLIYRIAYLMQNGIDPFRILSLTFTNKAAKEMKERIAKMVGNSEAQNLWMGTFHSVFAKILRIEAEKIGYPSNFTIYDTDDSKNLIKDILKQYQLDDKMYKPGLIYNRISNAKNNLISATAYLNDAVLTGDDRQSGKPKIGEIYLAYEKRCEKAAAMDFDDLLFKTYNLLNNHPDTLNKYQNKFTYLLVDEFQDTNHAQYLILKLLAAKNENICVVGDDAQSIYAFRGANIGNILNFQKDYTDTVVYKLEQNYRSTSNIVNAANSIIEKNQQRLKKNVWTHNEEGQKLKLIRSLTDNEEGLSVARNIFNLKSNQHCPNTDFAILYRTNAQSRSMEEALRKLNIPYRIYGGMSFYQRKEIKDLLAYFRMATNPHDEEALKRIINYPARGIGKTTIEKIIVSASEGGYSLWDIIANPEDFFSVLPNAAWGKVSEFVIMIKSFHAMLKTHNAFDLGSQIAQSSGLLKELYADKSPEGVSRYENIQELLNGLKEFSDTNRNFSIDEVAENTPEQEFRTLDEFMQEIALLTNADESKEDDNNRVALMTIHSAKGLEFPYVFITGLEENLFPSQLAINSRTELEEERRLFYVAVTRAQKQIFLSYATSRYKWGNLVYCEPSRFLEEIDNKYLENTTVNHLPQNNHTKFNGFQQKPFYKKETVEKPKNNFTLKTPSPSLKKVSTNVSAGPSHEIPELQVGMSVEHERFGAGKVINLEGGYPNQKATVLFPAAGQKQLLLKFARLKVLQ
jgi:DNA helicase II / ATP-dependent DNA helicase PcrA